MKTFFCIFLFNFILISTTVQAQAKRNLYTYQAAQVEFWYPNEWQVEEAERVTVLQNIDQSLSITFSIMEAEKIEEALIELESIMQTQLTNPTITTEPEIIELNGMMGVVAELNGTLDGNLVQLGVFIIDSPQNVLLVLGMGHKKALQQYNKALDKIIKSIKPI
ncbi:hypothetical protein [Aureispira anguillae]|uniref:DUF1795 domain-containing protein n=1 Tax=Aureispira anguillae TaxID=2864201 RepID=A0A915YLM6_9BACT|nr:hypothetical protein [Aureispira anguillae]BDS15494.1 hypothetical protein AsAng_0062780 [Aureispira anguillae]